MGRGIDLEAPDLEIGVVGTGAMGGGIAQIAAAAGRVVRMCDARPGAAAAARAAILDRLGRRVAEGRMTAAEHAAVGDRLRPVEGVEALAPCGLVIEAIAEDLEAKRALFRQLAAVVGPEAVLASNTSSLPIGAIAAALEGGRARVAGLHFFNPVPVMRLVEVIPGPETDPAVVAGLARLVRALDRVPVVAQDTPGFLVNYGGRAYPTEALAILQEGVATPAQIDAVMRDAWGFRMGPFELMDLTGIDVNYPVTAFIHAASFGDPRLRTTFRHRYMLETGQLGRKSGRGFYDYAAPAPAAEPRVEAAPPAAAVALAEPDEALSALLSAIGLPVLAADDGAAPLLAAPLGEDCSAFAARTGADHRRLVGVDVLGDTARRVVLMTAPGADPAVRAAVAAAFAPHRAVTVIADSPGFVGQRIAAMVANLGCEMAQMGLASPSDIDTAMRLGLNYPRGPIELADAIGPARVLRILTMLQALTGDDRYRPSPWLRRRAQLGLPAATPQDRP